MVGKIRHVRQKLHQEAVKLRAPVPEPRTRTGTEPDPRTQTGTEPDPTSPPQVDEKKNDGKTQVQTFASFPAAIFAATRITAESLVQTLQLEEPARLPTPAKTAPADQKMRSKKEKMKERRDRWLSKICSIKQARERQAAAARRQATPVVGDMRPLVDALPELSKLLPPTAPTPAARRSCRKNKVPVKKRELTDFSQMKSSHKRKLLETEISRFGDAVKILAAKTDPLADIGEQLRKRMRQEEEQSPS